MKLKVRTDEESLMRTSVVNLKSEWDVDKTLTSVCTVVGLGLGIYLALNACGVLHAEDTLAYYANFALVVIALASLYSYRDLARTRALTSVSLRIRKLQIVVGGLLASGSMIYIRLKVSQLQIQAPFFSLEEKLVGVVFIIGITLLILRTWGRLLAVIGFAPILYFVYGKYIPVPLLKTPSYTSGFILNYTSLSMQEGFFHFISVTTDKLFFMVLFGSVLFGAGALYAATELGKSVGKRIRGGAAFPAIIGSGAVGSVLGQAVANIGLSGRITIPMMMSSGYDGSMAAAIETMASTSGQFMPPLLGLAGFLMAGFLFVPYTEIALRSLIPAILFLVGIAVAVTRYGVANALPKHEKEIDRKAILRMTPTLVGGFGSVFYVMVKYQLASWAGMVGIAVVLVLMLLQGEYRPGLAKFWNALGDGIELITMLTILIFAIGPIGQVFVTTNLSGRLVTQVAMLLPHVKFVLLLIGMLFALILGMGLPTPIAYLLAALVMVPFLQQLANVRPVVAHFFVFYFAVFSTATPPLAVGVMAASRIAKAPFLSCVREALKISAVLVVIPYAFAYSPILLDFPHLTVAVIKPIVMVVCIEWLTAAVVFRNLGKRLSAIEFLIACIWLVCGYLSLVEFVGIGEYVFIGGVVALWGWSRREALRAYPKLSL